MGEASHPNRSEITIEATILDKRFRRCGGSKPKFGPDDFAPAGTRVSAIPWRNSEPDVLISPSRNFTGAQLASGIRRSGAKLKQFVIQRNAGRGSESRSEPGSEPGSGRCAANSRAEPGPDQRSGAHSP